ncbi:uncharacterized protein Dvir_GJ12260 [Drosophila virilis]|uniref:Uncharacterized protein n=2 Tax=Drosophila virilis TaxID=7244 RepID=B4LRJ1_DROVI|nr:uncharacterized protein LOC6627994 [Drosophila virilis]EDW63586.1 uncharacterized protein Dvir_GJ12260 [Drosophila virilis]
MLQSFCLILLATGASSRYNIFKEKFNEQLVTYLHAGKPQVQDALTLLQTVYSQNRIHIYCRRDQPLRLHNIFQSNRLQLITKAPNVDYVQYRAATAQGVYEAHLQRRECHEGKLLAAGVQQVRYITLPAHAHACYGIYTDQAYNLTLLQVRCDRERVARFVLGLGLWLAETFTPLGETIFCLYAVAIALGIHLASVGAVCLVLLSRGDRKLNYLRPVGANFKLVLEQHPTGVLLALIGGGWLLFNACRQHRDLWQHRKVRRFHCRLLRLLAYVLIGGASNHPRFGWYCVCLLLPWPELYWLLCWLRREAVKIQRQVLPPQPRRLLSEREFLAQAGYETHRALGNMRQRLRVASPSWEQLAQLQAPQQFARFLSSGAYEIENPRTWNDHDLYTTSSNNSSSSNSGNNNNNNASNRQLQTLDEAQQAQAVMLHHLAAVMNSDSNMSSAISSSSTESIYHNLHFTGSTRSLRGD